MSPVCETELRKLQVSKIENKIKNEHISDGRVLLFREEFNLLLVLCCVCGTNVQSKSKWHYVLDKLH
jgi:hypothetical protein